MPERRPITGAQEIRNVTGAALPLVLAPMAQVSGGALAAAVSRAGGLGFIGGGYCDSEWIAREMDLAENTPVGVGFITWALAKNQPVLDQVLERNPAAVFLSFGDIAPFVDKIRAANVPLFAQVQTVAQALEAVELGVDVIVAQGAEAGGHGGERGTLALVPAVRDAIGSMPLIAAGGIADGRTMAAALMLGADAVLCGTAFFAASESLAHPYAKFIALETSGDDTVRSSVFDVARGLDWPAPWTLRARRNAFHEKWSGKTRGLDAKERSTFAAAAERGDADIAAVIIGEAADLVQRIELAESIVKRVAEDALKRLKSAADMTWTERERPSP